MADGKWRIVRITSNTLGDLTRVVEEIRVWHDPETGAETPQTRFEPYGLILTWPGGHQDHYPWASVLKAEYHPPTKDPE